PCSVMDTNQAHGRRRSTPMPIATEKAPITPYATSESTSPLVSPRLECVSSGGSILTNWDTLTTGAKTAASTKSTPCKSNSTPIRVTPNGRFMVVLPTALQRDDYLMMTHYDDSLRYGLASRIPL